jgi:hypothetical protein
VSADGFPPPPPPDLSPPPGAVSYQTGPWSAAPLRRVGGLATALTVLLAIAAVTQVITALFIPSQIDNAEDLLAGRIDEDTYLEEQVAFSSVSLVTGAVTLAIVVLTMIWLHRVASNHRDLRRAVTWGPGWAFGGWFLPPLLYVIPTLMVREHWKAAEPSSPPGDDSWRRTPEPVMVWVWFALYSLVPIALLLAGSTLFFGGFGNDAEDFAENILDGESTLWLSALSSALAAIAWAIVVRGLTGRHRHLTGEASAR